MVIRGTANHCDVQLGRDSSSRGTRTLFVDLPGGSAGRGQFQPLILTCWSISNPASSQLVKMLVAKDKTVSYPNPLLAWHQARPWRTAHRSRTSETTSLVVSIRR